jgi:uncharacterized membrane protein YczE
VSFKINVSVGLLYTVFNGFFLVVGFFVARSYVGIGSLLMLTVQGLFLNAWLGWFQRHPVLFSYPLFKVLMALAGLLCVSFGNALSVSVQLGTAGMEASLFALADRIKIEYKYLKIGSEILFFIAAFFLGGVYGIMTVAEVFLYGFLFSFFIIGLNKTLLRALRISDVRNELYRNNRRWLRKMGIPVSPAEEKSDLGPLDST